MNIKQEIAELKTRLEQLEQECKSKTESEGPCVGDDYCVILPDGIVDDISWDCVQPSDEVADFFLVWKNQRIR